MTGRPVFGESVEIKISGWSFDRFLLGLLQSLVEPLREDVTAPFFICDRLRKQRLTFGFLRGDDSLGFVQLWSVLIDRIVM